MVPTCQAIGTQLAAAATADPYDSPMNGPFLVADSLLLFGQPNAQPSPGAPACVPTQEMLSMLANEVMGLPQSLGNRNASFTPARGITGSQPTPLGSRPWRDLQEHRGKSLVVAGDMQPAAVHKCRGAHSEEHDSPAVCALNRVSSPCSSTPVGRLPGMNPPMLAPRHPHLERSSAPTKVVRRRSLNDHVVVDQVRHSEDPRRHASRGRGHRQSTCCPVHCVLECP